jgi:hypothetical protein
MKIKKTDALWVNDEDPTATLCFPTAKLWVKSHLDPPELGVPVPLSIDAFFALHNVKKVARSRYWLIAFYDVNDLAA